MNLSIVSRYIGIALLFNAFFMFLGVAVSIIYDFDSVGVWSADVPFMDKSAITTAFGG